MVSQADCMAFLRSVLAYLMKDACEVDRRRVVARLRRLDQILSGRDLMTPRGRRVLRAVKTADETDPLRVETAAGEANCGAAPQGATIAENAGPICENAAIDGGGGI
jgi:hypothetical protein